MSKPITWLPSGNAEATSAIHSTCLTDSERAIVLQYPRSSIYTQRQMRLRAASGVLRANVGHVPNWLRLRLLARYGALERNHTRGANLLRQHAPLRWLEHAGSLTIGDVDYFVCEPYSSASYWDAAAEFAGELLLKVVMRPSWQGSPSNCRLLFIRLNVADWKDLLAGRRDADADARVAWERATDAPWKRQDPYAWLYLDPARRERLADRSGQAIDDSHREFVDAL